MLSVRCSVARGAKVWPRSMTTRAREVEAAQMKFTKRFNPLLPTDHPFYFGTSVNLVRLSRIFGQAWKVISLIFGHHYIYMWHALHALHTNNSEKIFKASAIKVFEPGLNSAEFEVSCLANVLRLRTHILERSEIPHMASSVDQVLRVQVAPISLGREIRVVAQVLPRICTSVDEQQPIRS